MDSQDYQQAKYPEVASPAQEKTSTEPGALMDQAYLIKGLETDEKRKKISRMTLSEIEEKLKLAQEKMGGQRSAYTRHLLARKSSLSA